MDGERRGRYEQRVIQGIANEVEKLVGGHVSKWTFGMKEYVIECDYSALLFGMRHFDDEQGGVPGLV